jgi:hypothetical protein
MTDPKTIPSGPPQVRPAGASAPRVGVRNRRNVSDLFELDPATMQADRHYHFMARSDIDQTRAKLKGYTIETEAKPIGEFDAGPDGSINIGDTVLMSCPKEMWEGSRADLRTLNEDRLAATTAATEEEARAKGVTIIKDKE